MSDNRFRDENKVISDFHKNVLVKCPACEQKCIAKVDYTTKQAEILCVYCGYNKKKSIEVLLMGMKASVRTAANFYFDAELWLKHTFKDDLFWAYNQEHLEYLESYIAAALREHKDRTHFTLLEKLPKFYHDAKNREALLKIIKRLKETI